MSCPVTTHNIQSHQVRDQWLIQTSLSQPLQFPVKVINRSNLICYWDNAQQHTNKWKIYIPNSLIQSIIRWYHILLGHCGFTKLYNTIRARFHCNRLLVHCKSYVCLERCHRYKQQGRWYGLLPLQHSAIPPWNEVCVDLLAHGWLQSKIRYTNSVH